MANKMRAQHLEYKQLETRIGKIIADTKVLIDNKLLSKNAIARSNYNIELLIDELKQMREKLVYVPEVRVMNVRREVTNSNDFVILWVERNMSDFTSRVIQYNDNGTIKKIGLNRIKPSYCPLCKRIHESIGQVIEVTANSKLWLHCSRPRVSTLKAKLLAVI